MAPRAGWMIDAGRRLRGRWTPRATAATIVVGIVALTLGLMALPGGSVVGDTTTNVRAASVLGRMAPGDEVIQPFVASNERLTSVFATFGTYGSTSVCALGIELRRRAAGDAVGTGAIVSTNEVSCADLPDTGPVKLAEFAPIADSAGQTYDLVIRRTDSEPGDGPSLWVGSPKGDAEVTQGMDNPDRLSGVVRANYDPEPHRWDHLAQTLSRLADYGPPWGTVAVYVALLAGVGLLVASGPLVMRKTRTLVVVVCLLALARGLVWSATIPAFEAMDEPAHFAYVQFLAEQHEFPGARDNHEIFSPRLSTAVAELNVESQTPGDRPDYTGTGEARLEADLALQSPAGGGGGPGSMYAPFYYLPAVAFYEAGHGDLLLQVVLARLWTVLLGVVAAGLLVLLGRQLFPGSSGAQLGFVLAGVLQPMTAHQFSIVNNDAWIIVWGYAALSVGLALARRGRASRLALLAGVVLGAALLGKPFAIACAVPMAVGWIVGKVRARERSLLVLGREILLLGTGVLLTYGAWMWNAARLDLNTSEVPAQSAQGQSIRAFLHVQFGNSLDLAKRIWADQMWGNFGWVRMLLPGQVTTVLFAIEIALAVGIMVWLVVIARDIVRRRAAGPFTPGAVDRSGVASSPLPLDVRILVTVTTIVGMVGTLYAAGYLYYLSTGANDLLQGRYALLALPAFLAAPALLAERFSKGRIRPAVVTTTAAFGMAVAFALGLFVMYEGFYG